MVVMGEKSGTHDPAWGAATLEFPEEQVDLVNALEDAGANVVEVVLMNRAYVMTEIVDLADSVLLAYRPGVTCGAEAVAMLSARRDAITGKTPFQIPETMEQVLSQREDLPKDIEDPLFEIWLWHRGGNRRLYEYGFERDAEGFREFPRF